MRSRFKLLSLTVGATVVLLAASSLLVVLGIFFVLLRIARRKSFHGQVVVSYLTLYAVARFALEYFRGDVSRGTVLGGLLSTSQFISILILFGVALVLPYLLKKQRIAPAAA